MALNHGFEIIQLPWNWTGRYDLDLAIVIYQDTVWMHVSHFFLYSFKFVPGSYHVVEQVPNLSLLKVPVDFKSVFYFTFQHIRKVIIYDLCSTNIYMKGTIRSTHSHLDEIILQRQKQNLSRFSIVDSHHLGFPLLDYTLTLNKSVHFHLWDHLFVLLIFDFNDSDRAKSLMILEALFWMFWLLISHL